MSRDPAPRPPVSRPVVAIAAVFVANGIAGPSFLARLPERQRDLDLSDVGLGVVLLGMAVGALAASPFAGWCIERVGSRRVVIGSATLLGTTLWCTGVAPTAPLLFAALVVLGAADAAMDISMNANAAAFEVHSGRSVMHGFHAAWSFGALAAAGVAAAAAATGAPLGAHLVVAGAVVLVIAAASRNGLDPDDIAAEPAPTETGERRRVSLVPVLLLAAFALGGSIIEGAPADWGALQLERLGVATGASALGFAAFMAGMLAGRLVGDRLTDRFGGARVLRVGASIAAAGILAGLCIPVHWVFAGGLFLVGLGTSGIFPLAFSAAARTPGVAPATGAVTVSLAARVGFLVEPVLMGVTAELTSLRWAFALVGITAVLIALAAPRLVPPTAGAAAAAGPTRAPPWDQRERSH